MNYWVLIALLTCVASDSASMNIEQPVHDARLTAVVSQKSSYCLFGNYYNEDTLKKALQSNEELVVARGTYRNMIIGTHVEIEQQKGRLPEFLVTSQAQLDYAQSVDNLGAYLCDQYAKNGVVYRNGIYGVLVLAHHFSVPKDICNIVMHYLDLDDLEYRMPKVDLLIMLRYAYSGRSGEFAYFPNDITVPLPQHLQLWEIKSVRYLPWHQFSG